MQRTHPCTSQTPTSIPSCTPLCQKSDASFVSLGNGWLNFSTRLVCHRESVGASARPLDGAISKSIRGPSVPQECSLADSSLVRTGGRPGFLHCRHCYGQKTAKKVVQQSMQRRGRVSAESQRGSIEKGGSLPARGEQLLERVISKLSYDLPRQYDEDMDWSVYADDVIFVDPVTRIKGKLQYQGMIWTLRLLVMAAFEPGTAKFDLLSIEEADDAVKTTSKFPPRGLEEDISRRVVAAVRTVWVTSGKTKWQKKFVISGDDIFRVRDDGLILSHESAWNEDPADVWDNFKLF